MQKQSIGKILAGSFLALLAGVCTPISIGLATPVLGVAGSFLYAWAGIVPAALFALTGLLTSYAIGGPVFLLVFCLSILLPAMVTMYWIHRTKGARVCLRVAVLAQAAGVLLSLLVAWLQVRMNLVDWWVETFIGVIKSMPQAFYTQFDTSLLLLMQMGAFGSAASGIDVASGVLTAADRLTLIDEYGRLAAAAYKVQLPEMLMTGSLLTGVLHAAWPVWIWARRGDERGSCRLPLSEWRVSRNAAIGLPLCALISYVLVQTGYPGGEAVLGAVWGVYTLMLRFQLCGAFSRRGKKFGATMFRRGFLMAMFMTTLSGPGTILGAISLYFGSQGLISTWMRNRKKHEEEE